MINHMRRFLKAKTGKEQSYFGKVIRKFIITIKSKNVSSRKLNDLTKDI